MIELRKRASLVVRATLVVGWIAVMLTPGYGQMPGRQGHNVVQPTTIWQWPYDPALMLYWFPWYSPCYPFASCLAYQQFQRQERRRERLEELRKPQPSPATSGSENRGGLTAGLGISGVPPRTNDADVVPGYLGSGQIREEYRESGELLPEFMDGSIGPRR